MFLPHFRLNCSPCSENAQTWWRCQNDGNNPNFPGKPTRADVVKICGRGSQKSKIAKKSGKPLFFKLFLKYQIRFRPVGGKKMVLSAIRVQILKIYIKTFLLPYRSSKSAERPKRNRRLKMYWNCHLAENGVQIFLAIGWGELKSMLNYYWYPNHA